MVQALRLVQLRSWCGSPGIREDFFAETVLRNVILQG